MALPTASDNVFPKVIMSEGASPATPSSGQVKVYAKSDGLVYSKDDAGVETLMSSGVGGLGTWTDYTPTVTATTTNPTMGSSTIAGRYKALDSKTYIVVISMSITTGGAWNAGSGEWKFSLPSITAAAKGPYTGSMHVLDAGVGYFAGICVVDNSATVIHPMVTADDTGNRILSHNKPVTWATGDRIRVEILVEVA